MTARELAMRRGASLADTVYCLDSLVKAGLCAPVRAGGRASAPVERLPARTPGPVWPRRSTGPFQPPSAEVLRKVLDGLLRLS